MECADKGKPYASQMQKAKNLFGDLVNNIFKELKIPIEKMTHRE